MVAAGRRCRYAAFVCPSGGGSPHGGRRSAEPLHESLLSASGFSLGSTAEGLAASGLAANALAGGLAVSHLSGLAAADADLISVACVPLFGPLWSGRGSSGEATSSGTRDAAPGHISFLQNGLMAACATEAVVATLQFVFADPINGLIGCSIATLGMQAASPYGFRFLPSFIVLSFCNGSMQLLLSLEHPALRHLLFSLTSSASAKIAGTIALASPTVMFVGLAVAWKLHCALRAYQQSFAAERERAAASQPAEVAQAAEAGAIEVGQAVPHAPWRPFSGEGYRLTK